MELETNREAVPPVQLEELNHYNNSHNNNKLEEDVFLNTKPSKKLIVIVLICSLSHAMVGYDIGFISSLWSLVHKDLGNSHALNFDDQARIAGSTSFGAIFGALLAGVSIDQFGKRYVAIVGNILTLIGAGVQCGSQKVSILIGGRFLMGWGVGVGSVIGPLLVAELSPPRYRGALITVVSIARNIFQLLAYCLGIAFVHTKNSWRIISGIGMIPVGIQSALLSIPSLVPESPQWHIERGRVDEAKNIWGFTHANLSPDDITHVNSIREKLPLPARLRNLFSHNYNLKGLLFGCTSHLILQFTGFNAIMHFLSIIFDAAAYESIEAMATIVGCVHCGVTLLITVFIIDICNRRVLLMCSLAGIVICLILTAVGFHETPNRFDPDEYGTVYYEVGPWGIGILISLIFYGFFYGIGVGAIAWIQPTEVFPSHVRAIGTSISCAVGWIGSVIFTSSFLYMMKGIKPTGTFIFFGAVTFLSVIFIFFLWPETTNFGLEEICQRGFNVRNSTVHAKSRRRPKNKNTKKKKENVQAVTT